MCLVINHQRIFYNYLMSNYSQLIAKLQIEGEDFSETVLNETLKKFIYLTVNDQKGFSSHAQKLFKQISKMLNNISQPETKLLCLQLMSEMATNNQKLIPSHMYDFPLLINFLSDQNAEVRKAAHYLLLTYVKKYQQIDQIIRGYHLKIQASSEQWKTIQKIIHSFQSLLIIEPKCVTYGSDYSNMDNFIQAILEQREDSQNNLIKKASEQAVTSFVKNQYLPLIIQKLNEHIVGQLRSFAQKNHINFSSNLKVALPSKVSSSLETNNNKKKLENNQASHSTIDNQPSTNNKSAKTSITQNQSYEAHEKQIKSKTEFSYRNLKSTEKAFEEHQKIEEISLRDHQNPKQMINLNAKHSKNAIELRKLVDSIDSSMQWKLKCDTIEQVSRILTTSKPQTTVDELPQDLLQKVLELTYDYNFKTCITAMNVLLVLVNDYAELASSNSAKQKKLEEVVIDKICDIKMAVRQIASRILRKIFAQKKNNSKFFLKFLLNKLSTCSVIGKEEILNFFQQSYSNEDFSEKIPFDSEISLVVGQVSTLLSHENTRIKIRAIDCLVKVSQSTDTQECKKILQKKLNKVYFDMFLERLKQKSVNFGNQKEQPRERWDEKNVNKGATWQAPMQRDRQKYSLQMSQKPFMTKMEFSTNAAKKLEDSSTSYNMMKSDEIGFEDTRNIIRNFNDTKTTNKTRNTYNTFNSTEDSVSQKLRAKKDEIYNEYEEQNEGGCDEFEAKGSPFSSNKKQISGKNDGKKLPMKPNPVKKRAVNNSSNLTSNMEQSQAITQNQNLVIASKQYMNRNLNSQLEEIKEEKPGKMMKFKSRPKQKRNESLESEQKNNTFNTELNRTEKGQTSSSHKPIFKSQKKQAHQIDYKATQYIQKDELKPVDSPKQLLKEIVTDLPKDSQWSKQFEALNGLRRLIKHHQDFYPSIHQCLPSIMPQVLKLVESLRSTLAKNGMMTLSEMCQALKKSMDPFLQGIFAKLFRKALDTNTFIIEEVLKCMASLCSYCTSAKICAILMNNAQSKSAQVKVKIIHCIDRLNSKMNYSLQLFKQNPKIAGLLSNYIMDGSAQVRNSSKSVFIRLGQSNSKIELENLFKRSSSREAWQKWKVVLDKELNIFTVGSKKIVDYD